MGVLYETLEADLTGVPPTARAVLLYLAARANKTGRCWPHQSTIAEFLGVKPLTIKRAIAALKKTGFITVQRTKKGNVYTLAGITTDTTKVSLATLPEKDQGNPVNLLLPLSEVAVDAGAGEPQTPGVPGGGNLKYTPKATKKIGEIKAEQDAKPKNVPELIKRVNGKPVNLKTFEQFWKFACHLEDSDYIVAGFTGKQYGFAKRIIKEFKADTFRQIGWAIENWPAYVNNANKMSGETRKPGKPSLGYVVTHLSELQSLSADD